MVCYFPPRHCPQLLYYLTKGLIIRSRWVIYRTSFSFYNTNHILWSLGPSFPMCHPYSTLCFLSTLSLFFILCHSPWSTVYVCVTFNIRWNRLNEVALCIERTFFIVLQKMMPQNTKNPAWVQLTANEVALLPLTSRHIFLMIYDSNDLVSINCSIFYICFIRIIRQKSHAKPYWFETFSKTVIK